MDAAMLEAIGVIGAFMVAQMILVGGLLRWQINHQRSDMGRIRSDMVSVMDRNHREVLTLLEGHDHPDDGARAFRRLPGSTGD